MVARFAGASLGLLAFAVTTVSGLYVGNPPTLILSRSILALLLFCTIGLLLGKAAQMVLSEYERNRKSEIERRYRTDSGVRESVKEATVEPAAGRT